MSFKIGFSTNKEQDSRDNISEKDNTPLAKPEKSVVRVYFASRNQTYSYYNDMFDLHKGDFVYVEGKLEGLLGRVADVTYSFKIRLSDYKRVISVVDTNITGEFYQAGSHFVTADKNTLPFEKVITWFKAPQKLDEECITGSDCKSFCLDNLEGMNIRPERADKGYEYYIENRVTYLELNQGRGRAIVKGAEFYEVEFEYNKGEIKNIVCDCFCIGACKHEFAVMLQLRETLKIIQENYPSINTDNGYFSAIRKATLFEYVIEGRNKGSFKPG